MNEDPVDAAFRRSVNCHTCFDRQYAQTAICDLPQPPWVGASYMASDPRVAILLTQPSPGGEGWRSHNTRLCELIGRYSKGHLPLRDIQVHNKRWMVESRFRDFFLLGVGLSLDSIAVVNLAWCAAEGNPQDKRMLAACTKEFTTGMLRTLEPTILLLSGSKTHPFSRLLRDSLPMTDLVPTLSYMHRKSRFEEKAEAERIKGLIGRKR